MEHIKSIGSCQCNQSLDRTICLGSQPEPYPNLTYANISLDYAEAPSFETLLLETSQLVRITDGKKTKKKMHHSHNAAPVQTSASHNSRNPELVQPTIPRIGRQKSSSVSCHSVLNRRASSVRSLSLSTPAPSPPCSEDRLVVLGLGGILRSAAKPNGSFAGVPLVGGFGGPPSNGPGRGMPAFSRGDSATVAGHTVSGSN